MVGVVLGLLSGSCTTPTSPLEQTTGAINGIARDETQTGVGGVQLRIINSQIIRDYTTDSTGVFSFLQTTVGTFHLEIFTPANYKLASGQASVLHISVDEGQTIKPVIELQKSPGTPAQPNVAFVVLNNFYYFPTVVTIRRGGTVTWQNQESDTHTVTSDAGTELSSGNMTRFVRYSHTFNNPGSYSYHCAFHEQMTGVIIVE